MHNICSRTLSSLEDNLKMTSKGQNMYIYIAFPVSTHTTGMTHFPGTVTVTTTTNIIFIIILMLLQLIKDT